MLLAQTISPLPFRQWLWQDKENKRLLCFSLVIMAITFGWLKYLYPYPNFMPPDSENYLQAAANNDFINVWPIGYSKFLRIISVFTRSHLILVLTQYILQSFSLLYFIFSMRYLLSPSKWLFRIILLISVMNPLLPHIANFVSSDCIFVSLSLIWFTQLLWIIYNSNSTLLYLHALIVVLAFTVRFTAIYYPFISVAVILSSSMPAIIKWKGAGAIALFILIFIGRTQYEYKTRTGTIQYSAFGGWQLAANALYGYAWAKPDKEEEVPDGFEELHTIVKQHMDSVRHLINRPDKDPGIYYLWDFKSPLRIYLDKQIAKSKNKTFFENWAAVAPLYNYYGRWLIKKYPRPFILHFAWPNLIRYYNPPVFFMGYYNLSDNKVEPVTVSWFQWKNNKLSTRTKDHKINIMDYCCTLVAILNPAFLISAIFFISMGGFQRSARAYVKMLGCMQIVWLCNTVFSVLSAPIELRYHIFPVIITGPFCLFFIIKTVHLFESANKTIYNKTLHYETILRSDHPANDGQLL
jgi:hypothetical protein